MRIFIPFILVFAGGAAVGWFVSPSDSASRSAPKPAPIADEAATDLAALEEELAWLQSDRDALEVTNQELEAQLAELIAMQELTAKDITEPPPEIGTVEEAAPAESEEDKDRRERREQMTERRQEMVSIFQDRFNAMMDEQFARLDDPAQAEGLSALLEWRDYQQELRGQMRDAQTDEERDEILAEMSNAQSTARQLLRDQQDAVLHDLAAEQGISTAKEQDKFVKQTREALKSPFFEMERMLTGGGPPGGMMGGRSRRGGDQRNY